MTTILYLHNKTGISGGERSLLNLWRNLDRSRFTPVLVIPGDGPVADEARRTGVTVEFCPVPKLTPWNLPSICIAFSTLVRLCRQHSVRIIHSYTPRNNLIAWAVSRRIAVPVIWHERNMLFGKEQDVSKLFLSLPDCIICNSNAVAGRFSKKDNRPSKVKTVVNGVDVKTFCPASPKPTVVQQFNPDHRKIIGIITNLSRRKGVELFIDIAAIVHKNIPDVHFLLVGGEFGDSADDNQASMSERIARSGLTGRITITGFVSNVHEIIPLFDIGVAVTEKEACSRAIMEIMACGKPVVAFDTGGNPEIIEHERSGLLYPFGDKGSFAGGIVELLGDADKAAHMGKVARKRAESLFDVSINARKTMDLYNLLLKGGRL